MALSLSPTSLLNYSFLLAYLFLGICLLSSPASAQTFRGDSWGCHLGLSLSVGKKINRIGIKIGVYAHWQHIVQGNLNWYGFYAFDGYGPRARRWEQQIGLGTAGAWGKLTPANDTLPIFPSQPARRPNSIAYTYWWYIDNIGMSQRSGSVAIQTGAWRILCENDLFAGQGRDRYRTGAFGIYYTHGNWRWSLVNILFTPDPKGTPRICDNHQYPARYGYFDLSQAKQYADCSHGIAALQVEYALPYAQIASCRIGIDSERVRHIVQNKLIHDLPMIPRRLNRAQNPHVPMIDKTGKPYLFRPEQVIKPASLWWVLSANPPDFYWPTRCLLGWIPYLCGYIALA